MTGSSAHLGDRVSAYVDRTLPAQTLQRLDRHLVACQMCRAATDDERRLLLSLRAARTPAVPTSLTEALHGLSSSLATRPAPVVAVVPAPALRVVGRHAPPLRRSPLRAVLLAGVAAGASAAAAWGITATGSPISPGGPALTPGAALTRLGGQNRGRPVVAQQQDVSARTRGTTLAGEGSGVLGRAWGLTVTTIGMRGAAPSVPAVLPVLAPQFRAWEHGRQSPDD